MSGVVAPRRSAWPNGPIVAVASVRPDCVFTLLLRSVGQGSDNGPVQEDLTTAVRLDVYRDCLRERGFLRLFHSVVGRLRGWAYETLAAIIQ